MESNHEAKRAIVCCVDQQLLLQAVEDILSAVLYMIGGKSYEMGEQFCTKAENSCHSQNLLCYFHIFKSLSQKRYLR